MTAVLLALAASPSIRALRARGVEFRVYDEGGEMTLCVSAREADCLGTKYEVPNELAVSALAGGWRLEGRAPGGRFDEKGKGELDGELVMRGESGDRRGRLRLPAASYEGYVRGEGRTLGRLSAPEWSEEATLVARSYAFSPDDGKAVFGGGVEALLPREAAEELGLPAARVAVECAEAQLVFGDRVERLLFRGGVRLDAGEAQVVCDSLEIRRDRGGLDFRATGRVSLSRNELHGRAERVEGSAGLVKAWDGEVSWKEWSFSFAEIVFDTESGEFTARRGRLER